MEIRGARVYEGLKRLAASNCVEPLYVLFAAYLMERVDQGRDYDPANYYLLIVSALLEAYCIPVEKADKSYRLMIHTIRGNNKALDLLEKYFLRERTSMISKSSAFALKVRLITRNIEVNNSGR